MLLLSGLIKTGIASSTGFNLTLSGSLTSSNILCYNNLSISGGIYSNSIIFNNSITPQNITTNTLTTSGIICNSLTTRYLIKNSSSYFIQSSNLPSVFIGDNNYYDPGDYGKLSITRVAGNKTRPHISLIRAGNIDTQMGLLESFTSYANNFGLYNNFSYNKTPGITLATNNYMGINQINPLFNLDISCTTCIRQSLTLNNNGLNNSNIILYYSTD